LSDDVLFAAPEPIRFLRRHRVHTNPRLSVAPLGTY